MWKNGFYCPERTWMDAARGRCSAAGKAPRMFILVLEMKLGGCRQHISLMLMINISV